MAEEIRSALLIICCVLMVPSGLSAIWHHLTIVGASGLTGTQEGQWEGSWSDSAGKPELRPYVRREIASIAVFSISAVGAWILYNEPALALSMLHFFFRT